MQHTPARLLAMWLLLVLSDHIGMIRVAIGPAIGIISAPIVLGLAWGWLALMLTTIIALLRRPRWAGPLLILLIPASTLLLGLSYVPFLMSFVPPGSRTLALIGGNAVALAASIWILYRSAPNAAFSAAG